MAIGEIIKVTPLMASRWVKAVFLVIIGVVILLYADKFVDELQTQAADHLQVNFDWTWQLLTYLLWILAAWLFVDAVLTVALSFSEHRFSLLDVMKRLDAIDKKLGIAQTKEISEPLDADTRLEDVVEEEVPPPPKE